MPKYRKRPIEIEAEQWFPGKEVAGVCLDTHPENGGELGHHVHTLEGVHRISEGDWVLTGVKGEKYVCRRDIFEETYEESVPGSVVITLTPQPKEQQQMGKRLVKISTEPDVTKLPLMDPKEITPAHSTAFYVLQDIKKRAGVPTPVDAFGNLRLDQDGPDRVIRV